jgi:hypothetical protein
MPNDVEQPVAFSFRDYRDEAIADFFANESRSFHPDISCGLSGGRLRLVGSSRSESQPTAAFRASISLAEGAKNIADNMTAKPLNAYSKNLKPTQKVLAGNQKSISQPKSNAQLKTTGLVGAGVLINDCKGNRFETASKNVNERIEAALSKPARALAVLSKSGKVTNSPAANATVNSKRNVGGSGVDVGSVGGLNADVGVMVRSGSGIKVGDLELPVVVTPALQPVLPLRDRITVLKKRAADNEDALRLVTLQVSDMQQEIDGATRRNVAENADEGNNNVKNNHGLKIVSKNTDNLPDLRVIDIVEPVEYEIQNQNQNQKSETESDAESELDGGELGNNCYDNVQQSIKFDQNLQKLIKSWSWLPDQIKETIISVVAVAEKEKQSV